jgi:Peptidase M50B-like
MNALAQATAVPSHGGPAPLPGGEAALIGLAAAVVVVVPLLWPFARHFSVMAHEGAHALVGGAMGFDVTGVKLGRDASGGTGFGEDTPGAGLAWVVTAFVGYLGPSAAGLGAAKLIERGWVIAPLWVALCLLVLLLLLIRRSFGIVTVPVAIALLVLVVRNAHAGFEEVISYAMTWLLLLSGVRVVILRGTEADDARVLRSSTYVPRSVWYLLWLGGSLLAVVVGGKWLVLLS